MQRSFRSAQPPGRAHAAVGSGKTGRAPGSVLLSPSRSVSRSNPGAEGRHSRSCRPARPHLRTNPSREGKRSRAEGRNLRPAPEIGLPTGKRPAKPGPEGGRRRTRMSGKGQRKQPSPPQPRRTGRDARSATAPGRNDDVAPKTKPADDRHEENALFKPEIFWNMYLF